MKTLKKALAGLMALVMVLAFGAAAFADGPVTMEQAKQIALDKAGVKAEDARFTRCHADYDDGRKVYEIEFFVGNTEYDMDVDVETGRVTDYSVEMHRSFGSAPAGEFWYYDDDYYEYEYYDRDFDDDFFDFFD